MKKQRDIYLKFNDESFINERSKGARELLNTKFLNSSPQSYTISIATIPSLQNARLFVNRYNLSDEAIVYEFGEQEKYSKVFIWCL